MGGTEVSLARVSEVDVESRDSIVTFLRGLGDKDLVEIFYDAVRNRSTGDVAEANRHYVIADVATEDGKWTVDVIAREDPERYPSGWAPDVPVCQWGVPRRLRFSRSKLSEAHALPRVRKQGLWVLTRRTRR